MATIYANIVGVTWQDPHVGDRGLCKVRCTIGAYAASSDSGSLGAGGKLFGTSTADTLETSLQKVRRDGKTVNVVLGQPGAPGRHGSTEFYADTITESSGSLTFELANIGGTEIDAASGISDRPFEIVVAYDLS